MFGSKREMLRGIGQGKAQTYTLQQTLGWSAMNQIHQLIAAHLVHSFLIPAPVSMFKAQRLILLLKMYHVS
jgi:hypothetical protein